MAVRIMPFAHWNLNWSGAAVGAGTAAIGALALSGEARIALALLAGAGVAAGALLAAGQLHFRRRPSPIEGDLHHVLGALPSAIAVTDRKGSVLWRSDAFSDAICSSGPRLDLSRLAERQPEAAAAIFRLFAAARSGNSHEETIALPQIERGEPVLLKVTPSFAQGSRSEYLIWQIGNGNSARASEGSCAILDSLAVPALLIAKDLSVEAASASLEKLLGSSPIGGQAWTLFRTKRGKPFTRAWLRDVIAKAEEPIAV